MEHDLARQQQQQKYWPINSPRQGKQKFQRRQQRQRNRVDDQIAKSIADREMEWKEKWKMKQISPGKCLSASFCATLKSGQVASAFEALQTGRKTIKLYLLLLKGGGEVVIMSG